MYQSDLSLEDVFCTMNNVNWLHSGKNQLGVKKKNLHVFQKVKFQDFIQISEPLIHDVNDCETQSPFFVVFVDHSIVIVRSET